ncbi:hypothetical protein [Teichococcus oryzae]|nr:hypothetical protein [Pseudoroseomonas oryzae]
MPTPRKQRQRLRWAILGLVVLLLWGMTAALGVFVLRLSWSGAGS